MANRSSGFGLPALPDIPSGGIDLDSIVKMAHLLEQQNEHEMKVGTPAKPGTPGTPGIDATPATVSPNASIMSRLLGGTSKVTPNELSGMNIPEGVNFAPGAGDLLTAGQPVYIKRGSAAVPEVPATPGTPGTLGTEELRIRAALADQVVPEDRGQFLTERGEQVYKNVKYIGKKTQKELYFNPQSGELSDVKQNGFWALDQDKAVETAASFRRAQIEAGGQGTGFLLRRYSELNDIKPGRRSEAQKTELLALDGVLRETLGIKGAFQVQQDALQRRKAAYQTDKASAMQAIQSIIMQPLSSNDKKAKAKMVLERMKQEHGDEDFYDLDEKKILKGM